MGTKFARRLLRMVCLFVSMLAMISGCSGVIKARAVPIVYPQSEKISLKVGLYLSEEFRGALWERPPMGWEARKILLGDALTEGAEAASRALFSRLIIMKDPTNSVEVGIDAILTPRMVSVEQTRPILRWDVTVITVMLEWSLKDVRGNTIWVDTVRGEGKSRLDDPDTRIRLLIEDLFRNSFQVIRSSQEIRKFVATRVTSQ